jgi:excisionase family DNA binding protein
MTKAVLTPPQVAVRWNCKADSIRALLASGKLRGFKVGSSHWRIALAEVERYERGETPAADSPRRRRKQTRRSIPDGPF